MENLKSSLMHCLFCYFLLWLSFLFSYTNAEVHYHNFNIQATPVKRLCKTQKIITVNGQYPGPTLEVRNGDTLIINVVNNVKYNITIHWHGVRQMRTPWADGPSYVTQCPIMPGGSYTYRFTIQDQEGTLWWHAHASWLRATVYGALIILPKEGSSYPFLKPHKEVPIIIGEWWNTNPLNVLRRSMITGAAPNISDAFTINGQPGDLYNCSSNKETFKIPVAAGETVLLRFINAAMNIENYIAIAGHKMTVVAADASYTKPFTTTVMMMGPGQTTDVLVTMDQQPGRYYIAARAYASAQGVTFDNTTTTAIIEYNDYPSTGGQVPSPSLPNLPAFNDNSPATDFSAGIRSPSRVKLPEPVNEHLFFTVGLGLFNCKPNQICGGPNGSRFGASMNNVSFVLPKRLSLLQAYYLSAPKVYTTDFPAYPPVQFDYTGNNISRALSQPVRGTKVYKLKYGSVVQLVLQGTNIANAAENHPMHLHGYHFYVLAQGFGNFNAATDTAKFNLVDPPLRNTVGVPVNGWAVIRFVADNPGVWFMHCHLDVHITWGLSMVFLVENGVGELQTLEPPPVDLPRC
ncbi:LOW QUALITY PROTEIN: laccase-3-like [Dioscorea cayenensis subsp. rotundata]|uniref:Laccase n=1 Tax=Dioscorea cayennensis subsp. rotundata TaxID=55577 RepID=A0AB40BQF9_DIOCR|nr:LOW QUALITY PROTEIN: laccase-3-like [Dioscorea cayenensis subsp. rotundata]